MAMRNLRGVWLVLGVWSMMAGVGHSQEKHQFELSAVGIRGGYTLIKAGISPAETENFFRTDVFAVLGFPGSWEMIPGWETRYRLTVAVGALTAAGDEGFIGEFVPNLAFTNWDWRVTIDAGGGLAVLSDYRFGRQNLGGPLQFIGVFGVTYHLPDNYTIGWRFHHLSDATIWGRDTRGIDLHMIEVGYRF